MLPLEVGDDANPTLILRFVPELGHCYDTKKRSPYKVAFETIRLFEADQWDDKIIVHQARETELEELKGE